MRIRVLGPIEVGPTEDWQPIGAAKWRALLALLVMHAGRPVSIDRIVAELWPSDPPRTATNQVHGYVARVRRALGDAEGQLLRTRSPGYVIAPVADVHRFEELAAEGAAALGEGDATAAVKLLAEALGIWRGPAYVDVPVTDAVRAEAARLEEQRLAALENRLAADLELGEHHRLVAELQALTEQHPYRERLWAHLMVALYRCDRQAEALAAYRRLVESLRDELGIEPGELVRRTHQQILTGELPSPDQRDAPLRQLPAAARHFVGRAEQLARLDQLAGSADRTGSSDQATADRAGTVLIAALTGPPGIGKTAAALRWAHNTADRFPDGQLYLNLRGFDPIQPPVPPTDALRDLLGALSVQSQRIPSTVEARAALFRSLIAGRRLLLVLDNARDAEQVRPLLPGSGPAMVVVTSRHRMTGLVAEHAAIPIGLDLLSEAEARQLLTAQIGADRVAAEPDAVATMVEQCTRLPLALTVVSARAAVDPSLPLSALADELAAAHDRLEALDTGESSTSPRAAFSSSYQAISPPAQRIFRLLGLHPSVDISLASMASMAAESVRRPLAELVSAQLVVEHAPGRYALHDLLRAYAGGLAHEHESELHRRAALHRLYDHYVHTAYAAARLVSPTRDPVELRAAEAGVQPEQLASRDAALAWFAAERAALTVSVSRAAADGFDWHAWQLAWTLVDCFDWQGAWQDWIATQEIAVAAAQRLGDPAAEAISHRFLGRAHTELAQYDDAHRHLQRSLELCAEQHDLVGEARAHQVLNGLFSRWDRSDAALQHARRALELFRLAGHLPGQADALNAVGWNHAMRREYVEAQRHCQQAVELHERLDHSHGQAAAWDSLGYVHHHLGEQQQAVDCYRRAGDIYREIGGDRFYEAVTLDHLGDAQAALGQHDAATESWRHAGRILGDLDHPYGDRVRAKLVPA